ncbi:amino acid ABC transporter permease [Microbacterium sp. JB110]|uniref:amino acid ABC transporter permease n=1 Tax=Microbacterium sp. JB110 TaxID=2024477 RepID=UPI00097E8EBB|nr:amino acid ABC transporter permease [Microbacterium sp. JB110]RCS62666.1 amino acid ABC transporter permease [Microbacterium sp. JB110]SJM63571.1 Glutamine transport system permease protein GlnP (TC 3.A.1.3.2) [Frigoribacterium sp. JB110]
MNIITDFDWFGVVEFLPQLGVGFLYTLLVAGAGIGIGFVLGAIFGLARLSRFRFVRGIAVVYIEVLRGTPLLVQAIWLFFALPLIIQYTLPSLVAGIIVIGLNSGAYIAEIVRGAVQSVDKGQMEAGRSLGMSHHITMRKVIWPQAFKRMIPPLGNQFIVSIKDTSLLSVILVHDLLFQARTIVASHFNAVEMYTTVAVFYLVITLSLSLALRYTEKRLELRS